MPPDPSRDQRLIELAQSVLNRPAEERSAFLREQVGDDDGLCRSLLGLIDQYEKTESFAGGASPEAIRLNGITSGDSEVGAWAAYLDQLRALGPSVDRYEDLGELARGGMGAIHRVEDKTLRRTLARKTLLPADADSSAGADASLGRFLEEAKVTSQLDHPGIVPIHDIGVDDQSRVYFTMKLVKGEDLRAIFERVRDPEDVDWNETRALNTLLRVSEAMAYAHEKGVIHRDLKPANIMVGGHGEAYVMDWGLARVLEAEERPAFDAGTTGEIHSARADAADSGTLDKTYAGQIVGTPAFMSPEQAGGRIDEMDPRSDVYSMGAILYQLLAGTTPYHDQVDPPTALAILRRVGQGKPTPVSSLRSGVAGELVAICERAMERDRADRYPDMRAFAADLRAYLENRVVRAHRTGAVAEMKKWMIRNPGAAAALGAFLLLFIVITGWFAVHQKSQARQANMQAALLRSLQGNAREAAKGEDWGKVLELLGSEVLQVTARFHAHGDAPRPLQSRGVVRTNESIALEIELTRAAHVYLFSEDEEGRLTSIFPLPTGELVNPLPPSRVHHLPGKMDGKEVRWLVSAPGDGVEDVILFASVEPIGNIRELWSAALEEPVRFSELKTSSQVALRGMSARQVESAIGGEERDPARAQRLSDMFRELQQEGDVSAGLVARKFRYLRRGG